MADLTIQFMDVGQGDGIFIALPNGDTMLVDLGSTKNKNTTGPSIIKYLQGFTKFKSSGQALDWLILTHGDRDHYNLVLSTLLAINAKVKNIIYGGYTQDYGSLIDKLQDLNPTMRVLIPNGVYPERIYSQAGAVIRIFAADTDPTLRSDEAWRKNTASIVLQVAYGGSTVLLTGDATFDTEDEIMTTFAAKKLLQDLSCNVLKLGHHGSHRTSNSANWLKTTDPSYVFISADRSGSLASNEKSTGHRHPQYITLDLLATYAPKLINSTSKHGYVSAYDSQDYTDYNNSPDTPPNKKQALPKGLSDKCWYQHNDTNGIFTSLMQMDLTEPGASPADQGVQYELAIDAHGLLKISMTS